MIRTVTWSIRDLTYPAVWIDSQKSVQDTVTLAQPTLLDLALFRGIDRDVPIPLCPLVAARKTPQPSFELQKYLNGNW